MPSAGVNLAEGTLGLHAAIQKFPDTHHRIITYTPSGTTRYRELFDPADDDPGVPEASELPVQVERLVYADTVPL